MGAGGRCHGWNKRSIAFNWYKRRALLMARGHRSTRTYGVAPSSTPSHPRAQDCRRRLLQRLLAAASSDRAYSSCERARPGDGFSLRKSTSAEIPSHVRKRRKMLRSTPSSRLTVRLLTPSRLRRVYRLPSLPQKYRTAVVCRSHHSNGRSPAYSCVLWTA